MKETIDGPAGPLELVVDTPAGPPRALAIVCHPHPLYGGSLDNKVVHQMARTFTELGAVAVRFNFRGVGASAGSFDEGRGETDDLLAVADWARGRWSGLPLWLAGFSFGAWVALRAAPVLHPDWLVTVAPPVNLYDVPAPADPGLRWLLVQGSADDVVPADAVSEWVQRLQQPPETVLLEGAGHFFHGRLNALRQVLAERAPV
ncbi:MAG TPA: alpha/beta hydrolase [Gammaproteobacteria bacterium]|nr:alpha/beta hydrolase [Gammaproteobacteria bacterium]